MRIGRTEVTFVSDGTIRLDGGAMFGTVPKALWRRWVTADRKNRVTIGLNCLLIKAGGKNILVDTGVGTKHPRRRKTIFAMAAGRLVGDLEEHGLSPADIDMVALTHLHFDHVGGCTQGDGRGKLVPTFPKATYLVQRQDWEEATQTNERTRPAYLPEDFLPLAESKQLTLLDGDTEIAPGVWLKRTGGHTAGHQMVYIDSEGQRAACLGDVLATHHHLPVHYTTAWDLYPLETVAQKVKLLAQAEEEGWLLAFGHGLTQRSGYLTRQGGRLTLRLQEL